MIFSVPVMSWAPVTPPILHTPNPIVIVFHQPSDFLCFCLNPIMDLIDQEKVKKRKPDYYCYKSSFFVVVCFSLYGSGNYSNINNEKKTLQLIGKETIHWQQVSR
jgi:hypothetical protein